MSTPEIPEDYPDTSDELIIILPDWLDPDDLGLQEVGPGDSGRGAEDWAAEIVDAAVAEVVGAGVAEVGEVAEVAEVAAEDFGAADWGAEIDEVAWIEGAGNRGLEDTAAPEDAYPGDESSRQVDGKARERRSRRSPVRLLAVGVPILGLAMVITLVSYVLRQGILSAYFPSPGRLSSAHFEVSGIDDSENCRTCHGLTGLVNGCLDCHEEISTQLAQHFGFHDFLLDGEDQDCARCHLEHLGRENELVSALSWAGQDRENFRHPHVEFSLEGKHDEIECAECHDKKLQKKFTLPRFPSRPREHTHLGLGQECIDCHEDIHSHGLSGECESCHGQDAFRPAAYFDHNEHFSLLGGHERVECAGCHLIPDDAQDVAARLLPFDKVRGTRCTDCHESPHRTWLALACETCHVELAPTWSSARGMMTADLHALAGFLLDPPHERVDCESCHRPESDYEESHPDPSLPGYQRTIESCQGCHEDEHGGQFAGTHPACLDCHDRLAFEPHHFDLERHAPVYPLVGAHAEADCRGCHQPDETTGIRQFVDTTKACKACHDDPHSGQFEKEDRSCADCHDSWRFKPANFDLEEHTRVFPLSAPHAAVPCTSCHALEAKTEVRMFVSTNRDCKGCHQDPHGGQFARELIDSDCTVCHDDAADTFAIADFDHAESTAYPLVGAHSGASCDDCHVEAGVPDVVGDTASFRIYRGTSRECSSCHMDYHRGQFLEGLNTNCSDCHQSTTAWSELVFDHNTQSRFPLDGKHLDVSCDRCHPRVDLPEGGPLLQFKPLGTECNDCHEAATGQLTGRSPRRGRDR